MESQSLTVQPRQGRGSQTARKLRRQGLVPGVVYGHKEATVSVALPADELQKAIRHGVRVVDLKLDGKTETAFIRAVQWDHLGKDLLHVDFTRVAADERITVTVPIELRGTPQGLGAGGVVLDQPLHTLEVECLALKMPERIRVNIAELQLGHAIHVKDLVLPPDVKAKADPETVVVLLKAAQVEPEVAPAAPAAEGTEPEVIGRKEKPEEEEKE
jgi:large subunit ribosomal protein L25